MDRWTDGQINGQTDGRRDRWIDGQTDQKVAYRHKNIQKHLELAITPFKQLCDGQTDRPTDQLTNQKVAYRGL